jgi:hypothetical protein
MSRANPRGPNWDKALRYAQDFREASQEGTPLASDGPETVKAPPCYVPLQEGEYCAVSASQRAAVLSLADEMLKDSVIRLRVSRGTLHDHIIRALQTITHTDLVDARVLRNSVSCCHQEILATVESWQSVLAVDNLVLDGVNQVRIGSTTLLPTDKCLPTIERSLGYNDEDEAPLVLQTWKKYLLQEFSKYSVVAVVQYDAEKEAIEEVAEREVNDALNLLRCYGRLLWPFASGLMLATAGGLSRGLRPEAHFRGGTQPHSSRIGEIGSPAPYKLEPEHLQFLKRDCAFAEMSRVLAVPEETRTGTSAILGRATRWIGQGVADTEQPEAAFRFAVAAELMMMGESRDAPDAAIGDQVARRLAYLLGGEVEERRSIYREAKALYGVRSAIAHIGQTNVDPRHVRRLEHYAIQALIRIAQNGHIWPKHEDFTSWVSSQEFK